MIVLMQLVSLAPSVGVLLAAGTLVTMGLRVERRVAAGQAEARRVEVAAAVLQAVADSRAPGRSTVPLPSGVAMRLVRADGRVCRFDGGPMLTLERGGQVRTPVVGDSLLVADTAAADRWRALPVAAVAGAICPGGSVAWRLTLGGVLPAHLDDEGLIVEWLEFSVSSGPSAALQARASSAVAARQPALDLQPGVAALVVRDAAGTPLGVGALGGALLELRHGVADTVRIRLDRPGGA